MKLLEFVHKTYWHGSDIAGLDILRPRDSEVIGKRVVFAATVEEIAVAMSGHWTDQDFTFGRSMSKDADPDRVPYKMKELKAGAFEKFFSEPISLYEVNGRDFHDDSMIQDFEVIASKPVKVLDEKVIDDPLDYLKSAKMVKLKFFS